jgi:N-acetylglucosaminyl-diphospho-decaprenol L-rhamnosyltransferase
MSTSLPIVSVLIVTFNSELVIGECIRALVRQGDRTSRIEVILIDNDSSDQGIQVATDIDSRIRVIRSPQNLGFARAMNLGAREATGDYFLLLNPDAVIEGSAVIELAQKMREDRNVGISAPLVLQGDGRLATLGAGRSPTAWRMFLHASGLARFGSKIPALEGHYLYSKGLSSRKKSVDWVSGGCLLIERSLWGRLQGLTTRWFMYAEDIDLCLRVRALDHEIVVYPSITARHAVGGSTDKHDGQMSSVWLVNLFDLYCVSIARNRTSCYFWRLLVVLGFRGRQLTSGLKSSGPSRTREMRRFGLYAKALQRAPITFTER